MRIPKTVLKKKMRDSRSSVDATDERMQQKMEEMEERMQQRMQEKFNAQWNKKITMNVVARLQCLNPDLRLDPNMLMFNARAPGGAASAQQTAIQLIDCPSAGGNNQGVVDEEMEDEDTEDLDLT